MRPDPQKEVDMPEYEYRGYHIQCVPRNWLARGEWAREYVHWTWESGRSWEYYLDNELKGSGSSVEACEEAIDEDLDEGDEG